MKNFLVRDKKYLYIGLTLVVFALLRIVAWSNVEAVEDHDSIYYLSISRLITNLNFKAISEIGPDATFLYPLLIAIFNIPGWFTEFGARLLTFTSSVLLFFSIFKLGLKVQNYKGAILGLLILAFNPFYIIFSVSILTEPLYIANIYFGFWYFLYLLEKPSISKSFLLGLIYGLSFLNRTEGIVFLVFIPFLLLARYILFNNGRDLTFSLTMKIMSVYVAGFLLLSVPQIWYNSQKMGTLALNGRQVWQTILHTPDNKSYDEKLRGLDYSDKDVNLKYLQKNPQAYKSIKTENYVFNELKNFANGFIKAYSFQLNQLVGIIVLLTVGMGILSLLADKKTFELVSFSALFIVVLIPPLFHNFDLIRHIAISGPILMLLSGIGISHLSTIITGNIKNEQLKSLSAKYLTLILFFSIPLFSITLIYHSLKNSQANLEYSPTDISKTIAAFQKSSSNTSDQQIIISRKNYFPYYSGSKRVDLPYTTYEKLVRYAKLNKANYIYFQSNEIENYPYGQLFINNTVSDFILEYSAKDRIGQKIFLYKLKE